MRVYAASRDEPGGGLARRDDGGFHMERIKAIETVYNGYRFRSRLEARWAIFMDRAGIPYFYEPEGFILPDGTRYLPDFYLPDSKTFVECKGIMTPTDEHKINMFIEESRRDFLLVHNDLTFQACDNWDGNYYTLAKPSQSVLCQCLNCGKKYFMGWTASWMCKCCGVHEGDGHFVPLLDGDGDHFCYSANGQCATPGYDNAEIVGALFAAKQARFEHGEKP